jgi:hypothetical protein
MLAHDTKSYPIIESIMRSPDGKPNMFVTTYVEDNNKGVYTLAGKTGAHGSGFTVRFVPLPEARLGSDFVIPYQHTPGAQLREGEVVILKNRNAFRVIMEQTGSSPIQYFQWLLAQRIDPQLPYPGAMVAAPFAGRWFGRDEDLGMRQILRLETQRQLRIKPGAAAEINQFVQDNIFDKRNNSPAAIEAVNEWLRMGELGDEEVEAFLSYADMNLLKFRQRPEYQETFEAAFRDRPFDTTSWAILSRLMESDEYYVRTMAARSILGHQNKLSEQLARRAFSDGSPRIKALGLAYFLNQSQPSLEAMQIIERDALLWQHYGFNAEPLPDRGKRRWNAILTAMHADQVAISFSDALAMYVCWGQFAKDESTREIALRLTESMLAQGKGGSLFFFWLSAADLSDAENINKAELYLNHFNQGFVPQAPYSGKELEVLRDLNNRKARAAKVLAQRLPTHTYKFLEMLMRHEEPRIRQMAGAVLVLNPDPTYAQLADIAMASEDPLLRLAALDFWLKNKNGVNDLKLAEFALDEDPQIQNRLFEYLDKRAPSNSSSRGQLLVNLVYSHAPRMAGLALERIALRDDAQDLITLLLTETDPERLLHIANRFRSAMFKGVTIQEMIYEKGISHPDEDFRARVVAGLANYPGSKNVERLYAALHDPSPLVYYTAVNVLVNNYTNWIPKEDWENLKSWDQPDYVKAKGAPCELFLVGTK